eukprot:4563930-Alexandrium_andersonii.AAC.1
MARPAFMEGICAMVPAAVARTGLCMRSIFHVARQVGRNCTCGRLPACSRVRRPAGSFQWPREVP